MWGYCKNSSGFEIGNLLPGRKCSNDYECYNSKCNRGYCYGLSLNSECTSNYQCEPGLTCQNNSTTKTNICSLAKYDGDSCDNDS